MWNNIKRFIAEDEATTAVEYCVMIALILLVIIGGLTAAGGGTSAWWSNIGTEMTNSGI